jgi:hypothetical protein
LAKWKEEEIQFELNINFEIILEWREGKRENSFLWNKMDNAMFIVLWMQLGF